MCQHKPSSKDSQWEMSEEKEKFDKGRSLGSLLEMCHIYHRITPISHFSASLSYCLSILKAFLDL